MSGIERRCTRTRPHEKHLWGFTALYCPGVPVDAKASGGQEDDQRAYRTISSIEGVRRSRADMNRAEVESQYPATLTVEADCKCGHAEVDHNGAQHGCRGGGPIGMGMGCDCSGRYQPRGTPLTVEAPGHGVTGHQCMTFNCGKDEDEQTSAEKLLHDIFGTEHESPSPLVVDAVPVEEDVEEETHAEVLAWLYQDGDDPALRIQVVRLGMDAAPALDPRKNFDLPCRAALVTVRVPLSALEPLPTDPPRAPGYCCDKCRAEERE